jgi:sugar-specific transcriptional regulator TrmB
LKTLEQAVSTLKDLGLTTVQAKTYIALVKLNGATIKEIAQLSKVPRTDLYRSIEALEKKGLVEKIISKPSRFKTKSIDECINILHREIEERNRELLRKAVDLRDYLRTQLNTLLPHAGSTSYLLVPNKSVISKIRKAITELENSLDVISSFSRFSAAMVLFADEVENAWSRGVKCRFILEKPTTESALLMNVGPHVKKTTCRFKFIDVVPQTVVAIYDRKQVIVIENPKASLDESPCLWSNKQNMVSMSLQLFEMFWRKAKEDKTFSQRLEPSFG